MAGRHKSPEALDARILAALRRREKQLLSAAEGNAAGLTKAHGAVVAIVAAADIQALNQTVRTRLPGILDIEAAALCIGDEGALALVDALKVNRVLTSLDLANNKITRVGALALDEVLSQNEVLSFVG